MAPTHPHPDGDVLPPPASLPVEDYAPAQSRPRSHEYSEWDPRSAPATYSLLALNVAVYLWMVLHGVSPRMPRPADLIHYGANCAILVLHGQWYRLLTATFVHVGLIHLATNMWCLWNLGMLGEPLVGPFGLAAVYMLTGITGNLLGMGVNVLTSLRTNDIQVLAIPGAGASGAVFGIAGLLIVLLSNRKLPFPWAELSALRRRVIQFAAINLVIGLAANRLPIGIEIDNMAHIGGFLSGLALGVPLIPKMTSGRTLYLARQKIVFASACFLLALFGYGIANLQ